MSKPKESKSIQSKVIGDLLAGFDVVTELLSLPPYAGPRHNFEYHMARKEWERVYGSEIKKRRVVKEMRKKKWIDDRQKGNEIIVRIFSDAIVASLKERIRSTTKKLRKGSVCLLSYDFPNGATKARNFWRRLLRSIGLKKEQLSLYSTERDVLNELRALMKVLGAEKWIRVFLATET
jgi:hypothetical protein